VQIVRWLVVFVCLLGVGGFIADFLVWETARQHMANPAWPKHANFHNAQTMLMGIGLGLLGSLLLFLSSPLTISGLLVASGAVSLYWVGMLLAPLFPETAWNDPEFRASTPRLFGLHPQQSLAYAAIGILAFVLFLSWQYRQHCQGAQIGARALRSPRLTLQNSSICHSSFCLPVSHVTANKALLIEKTKETNEAEDSLILGYNGFRDADYRDLRWYVDCARGSAHEGTEAPRISGLLRKHPGCREGHWPNRLLSTRYARFKEWAYAGFSITVLSACYSHFSSGDGFLALELLLTFAALVASYFTRPNDRKISHSVAVL
jgi:hypothetical protein